jgi:hypothetical protein
MNNSCHLLIFESFEKGRKKKMDLISIIGLLAMFLLVGVALTQDKKSEYKDGVEASYPVNEGSKIFAGALVAFDTNGDIIPGADTAGLVFAGVSLEYIDNSGGADGALNVLVRRKGVYRMKSSSSLTKANVGNKVFLVDDQTVGLAATTTNDVFCGVIAEFISSSEAWIDIEPAVNTGRGT